MRDEHAVLFAVTIHCARGGRWQTFRLPLTLRPHRSALRSVLRPAMVKLNHSQVAAVSHVEFACPLTVR